MVIGIIILASAVIAAVVVIRTQNMEDNIVATIEEAVADLKQQVSDAADRVVADVAELQRIIAEDGNATQRMQDAADAIEASANALKEIDPLPDFPPAPAPGDGGGTT